MKKDAVIALAGQPNCGKSTLFNSLTGASQHVANYPGVTVDKMSGWYRHNGKKIEVVDLPGTYSLTSYSLEERVSRDFIISEKPNLIINIADAATLKRSLYLTFQLIEMDIPLLFELNMMDVAEGRGLKIDVNRLSERLNLPVVPTSIKKGKGKKEVLKAINNIVGKKERRAGSRIDYGEMEEFIRKLEEMISAEKAGPSDLPGRWLAIKLMEGDGEVQRLIREHHADADEFLEKVERLRSDFEARHGELPAVHIAHRRYETADEIIRSCTSKDTWKVPLSERIDRVVCNRFMGPVVLIGVIWLLYYLSIVQGYRVTNYTWPLLAQIRSFTEAVSPTPGFIDVPVIRAFALWFVDSINALLNYIPIFFILFSLIAILEDSGYMPRMAFIMDRLFSRFGLHGQSTLPMVLGGVYVGGCAVPAVMSCKGIPDERSRFATILIIPLLNCLAKVPLYVLLINIYFAEHKTLAMLFISTISLLCVLPISKLLTLTVLRKRHTAPFVMEMPPYHIPSVRSVLKRATERVWLFIRKITTIVAAVAVVIFVLLQFPRLDAQRVQYYEGEKERAVGSFLKKIQGTVYADRLNKENLMPLVLYWDDYKGAKMGTKGKEATAALNEKFREKNPGFFRIVRPGKDKEAKKVNRAFKKLFKARKRLLREIRKENIDNSFLGRLGRVLEPASRWAGFNWRVNVALLSAFAAKESSVATLGALYQQEDEGESLEKRMEKQEGAFTSLHALALMLFMVLYPPCIATTIAVKIQTGSVKWMLFSMIYPMILGLFVAVLVFSGGSALGLTGVQAMMAFYGLALSFTILMGFIKNRSEY